MQCISTRFSLTLVSLFLCSTAFVSAQSIGVNNPAANTNTVCLAKSSLKCIDTEHATVLWTTELNSDGAEFYLDDDTLIITDYETLSSYEPRTGILQWTQSFEAPVFPPSVVDNSVYISGEKGIFARLDKESGKIIWLKHIGSGWNYIAAGDAEHVVAVGQDHKMRSFNKTNGILIHTIELGQEPVYRPLMVNARELLVSTFANRTASISPATGETVWEVRTRAPVFRSLIIGDAFIESSMDGSITAREIKNGTKLWERKAFSSANFSIFADLTIVVAIGEGGNFFVFDINNGNLLRRSNSSETQISAPVLHNSRLQLLADNGFLTTIKQK